MVLLGDIVELRDRPIGDALDAAGPFFDALGEAAAGAEIFYAPGNHDHHLFSSWRESQRLSAGGEPMGLEQIAPVDSGPIGEFAETPGKGVMCACVPGALGSPTASTRPTGAVSNWRASAVRPSSGSGSGQSSAVIGGLSANDRAADKDSGGVLAPLYAFLFSLAQSGGAAATGPGPSARVWSALAGGQSGFEKVKGMLLGSVSLPGAIAVARIASASAASTPTSR